MKNGKSEKKSSYTTRYEKRQKFIEQHGQEEFDRIAELDENWGKLKDIPLPVGSHWLFNHFLSIWHHCEYDFNGNIILRPIDITNYCECFCVSLTIDERKFILQMKNWALESIHEAREVEE